jgi:hypothetical protein
MLLRISLIVAILAGLAIGALNFVMVKEKITTLQTNLANEKTARATAEQERDKNKREWDKTAKELASTKQSLDEANTAKDKALADLANETKRADKLTDDLTKTRKDLGDANAALEAYRLTELKPEEIIAIKKQYKGLEDSLAGAKDENKLLGRKIDRLQTELDRFVHPEKPVYLPADLTGKVLVADPKWNFVVLNIGEEQQVKEYGELLVNRKGRLVAKVIVRSIQKDRSIANVLPGWSLGEILEGDQVIPAHPQPAS